MSWIKQGEMLSLLPPCSSDTGQWMSYMQPVCLRRVKRRTAVIRVRFHNAACSSFANLHMRVSMAGYPNQPSAVIAFACFVCRLIFAYVIDANDWCKECLGWQGRSWRGTKAEAKQRRAWKGERQKKKKKRGTDPKTSCKLNSSTAPLKRVDEHPLGWVEGEGVERWGG